MRTTDVSGPAISRILAKIVASRVVLVLNRLITATQTRRNVDLSHVRIITQTSDALFKLDAAMSMRLHPTEQTRKDAGVQPAQNDRLKHSTNSPMNMDT